MICEKIDIWEGLDYDERKQGFRPTLEAYIPDENNRKAKGAVMVLPGGAYAGLAQHEGEPIALQFCAHGLVSFVLKYSTSPCIHPQPLRDVTRAMCIIKDNADRWNINKNKISVLGFSAGGHLAASIGTMWHKDYLLDVEGMEYGKNKPDTMILCYPVILSAVNGKKGHDDSFKYLLGENVTDEKKEEMSIENNVSGKTVPAFIWHTFDDGTVNVQNSMVMADAMRKCGIPLEYHLYEWGEHGLGFPLAGTSADGIEDIHIATWMNLCLQWLDLRGYITND